MKKITPITREEIQNILKEVNYPGFSRDIVSFGMVKDILIQGVHINISLQINSDNETTLVRLQTTIHEKLKEYGESCDLIPNLRIRQRLSVLSSKEITCIEELPTFVNALKSEI